jgi:hypothetical protein
MVPGAPAMTKLPLLTIFMAPAFLDVVIVPLSVNVLEKDGDWTVKLTLMLLLAAKVTPELTVMSPVVKLSGPPSILSVVLPEPADRASVMEAPAEVLIASVPPLVVTVAKELSGAVTVRLLFPLKTMAEAPAAVSAEPAPNTTDGEVIVIAPPPITVSVIPAPKLTASPLKLTFPVPGLKT